MKTKVFTDIDMLRDLVKQANGFGARLRVIKSKKPEYDWYVSGQRNDMAVRMAGTASWLYDELLRALVL